MYSYHNIPWSSTGLIIRLLPIMNCLSMAKVAESLGNSKNSGLHTVAEALAVGSL